MTVEKIRQRKSQGMIVITHENVHTVDWDKWMAEFERRIEEWRKGAKTND